MQMSFRKQILCGKNDESFLVHFVRNRQMLWATSLFVCTFNISCQSSRTDGDNGRDFSILKSSGSAQATKHYTSADDEPLKMPRQRYLPNPHEMENDIKSESMATESPIFSSKALKSTIPNKISLSEEQDLSSSKNPEESYSNHTPGPSDYGNHAVLPINNSERLTLYAENDFVTENLPNESANQNVKTNLSVHPMAAATGVANAGSSTSSAILSSLGKENSDGSVQKAGSSSSFKSNPVAAQHAPVAAQHAPAGWKFFHLAQGGYKKSIQGDQQLLVIDDYQGVMDFLKFAEFSRTQADFSDWLKFDFDKEQVVVFLARTPEKGHFVQLKSLNYDGAFRASYEVYEEASNCSLNQWISTEIAFHLVRIPKQKNLPSGAYPVSAQSKEIKDCHGLLANFSQSEFAEGLPAEIAWKGNVERFHQKVTVFQRSWGQWKEFSKQYCANCSNLETKSGFPDHRIAILISFPGEGQLHLRKAFRKSGLLFIDLERDDCAESKNSILLVLDRKDLDFQEGGLDLSKIALTGPWVPKSRSCQN